MSFSQGAEVLSFREQIKEIFMLYCGNVCAHLQQMFPGLSVGIPVAAQDRAGVMCSGKTLIFTNGEWFEYSSRVSRTCTHAICGPVCYEPDVHSCTWRGESLTSLKPLVAFFLLSRAMTFGFEKKIGQVGLDV